MTDNPRNPTQKPRGRPFQPGNAGKPVGTRRKITVAALALIEAQGPDIVNAMIKAALSGDVSAGRALLDRLVSPVKSRPVALDLPPVHTATDIAAATGAVVAAVADGRLNPDEGAVVAGLLETLRRAIETSEVERRITVLEQQNGGPK